MVPDVEEVPRIVKEHIPTITAGTSGGGEGSGSWLSGIGIGRGNLSTLRVRPIADQVTSCLDVSDSCPTGWGGRWIVGPVCAIG